MTPYRIKHKVTRLYYQPLTSGKKTNLSKKGKIYTTKQSPLLWNAIPTQVSEKQYFSNKEYFDGIGIRKSFHYEYYCYIPTSDFEAETITSDVSEDKPGFKNVNLDIFEMYYFLESCFRGSHLRSGSILRFVDEWYNLFSKNERKSLYTWILRDIYEGVFSPNEILCGADEMFMIFFNPENEYIVKTKDGNEFTTHYDGKGKYYITSNSYLTEDEIETMVKQ